MKVVCEEVFGPVVNVLPYQTLDEVFATVNAGEYGLQAGIFTRSNEVSFRAIRSIIVASFGTGPRGHGPGRSPCFCLRVEIYASIWVVAIAVRLSSEQ